MATIRSTATVPQQTVLQIAPTTFLQRDDIEQREIRQTASIALQQYSVLAVHSIATGESPAQTRLRMMRYLSGLPQPANVNLEEKPSTDSEASTSSGVRSL